MSAKKTKALPVALQGHPRLVEIADKARGKALRQIAATAKRIGKCADGAKWLPVWEAIVAKHTASDSAAFWVENATKVHAACVAEMTPLLPDGDPESQVEPVAAASVDCDDEDDDRSEWLGQGRRDDEPVAEPKHTPAANQMAFAF